MIKRQSDYWMKHGSGEDIAHHFQQLIVTESGEEQRARQRVEMANEPSGRTHRDTEFENFMPILNTTDNSSAYLQYLYQFITSNLTDVSNLAAITRILDIGRFRVQKKPSLIEEFSMDSNLLDVVKVLTALLKETVRVQGRAGNANLAEAE
jgi:hypothetical protein